MEPRKEEKVTKPRAEEKRVEVKRPKRFRLIRLEERIAPSHATHKTCTWTL